MAKRISVAVAKPHDFEALVAEAAYYRAERRGFSPGKEIDDWLEAEHEIEKILTGRRTTAPNATTKAMKPKATAAKPKATAAKPKATAARPKAGAAKPKKAAAKPKKAAKA